MRIKQHIRTIFDKPVRIFKFRILHADDSPHRIALGVAIGLFIAWTPALGLHIIIALAMTSLLRANKFAALTFIWASNPFTFVPIYYPNFLLGRAIMKFFCPSRTFSSQHLQNALHRFSPSTIVAHFFHADFWKNLLNMLWRDFPELWLGSLIMGLLVAIVSYFATYCLIKWHRKSNPHRRLLRHQ